MVRHVILWKLKEMPAAEQETVKADIKAGLEGLAGQIPGLTEIHVYTKALPSSANADLMLDTTFVDEAALKGYAVHPAHVAVADGKVRPYTAVRTCPWLPKARSSRPHSIRLTSSRCGPKEVNRRCTSSPRVRLSPASMSR